MVVIQLQPSLQGVHWGTRNKNGTITDLNLFTPQHQYAYSPYCSLYISLGADKENLFNNQEVLQLIIISFILLTLVCDLGVWL